ncbi:unnamed protein product [Phytophthora fragariaefolia]|uniref:Unnamed protein product n=1 Tax=Phytophthora fragariaefolia TaxID=1490495 RepID=A0A9W6U5L1_9STRA|nr:unnamed protein product [Phytophthora fragariaefolia]
MVSSRVAAGEANEEGPQLENDIPGAVRGSESQPRLPWTKVWRSTDPNMLTVYRESLPSHSGNHVMDTNAAASPVQRKLTQGMKDFIWSILSGGEKTTATRLYTLVCTMVANNEIAGPAPKDSQVSDFVKNWRCTNPKDSMAALISMCEGRLYEQLDFATLGDRERIILCDSQPVL